MTRRDLVVIGASAGGLQALTQLAAGLPSRLEAALLVVVHSSPDSPSFLPHMLANTGPLSAKHAVDGEPIRSGHIYIAPPDRHLLVKDGTLQLTLGPRENGFRPAVDPLFRTAAQQYGPRTIGIVLSGGLDDGTLGLAAVKQRGGITIAQDPTEAVVPNMPLSAIANVDLDHVVTVAEMGTLLGRLTAEAVGEGAEAMKGTTKDAADVAEHGTAALETGELAGPLSPFTCPECGGALWQVANDKVPNFRCHVGHGFTAEHLLAGQENTLETALWTALRVLEENAAFRRRMAVHARGRRLAFIARSYERRAREVERRAATIRAVLTADSRPARRRTRRRAASVSHRRSKVRHA